MAKGQKRSNREPKKPKTKKAAAPLATASPFAKGELATTADKKKK